MKKNQPKKAESAPSVLPQQAVPGDSFELINNFGTYNIQPTADTDHMYPAIAQGFHAKLVQSDAQNKAAEKSRQKLDK